jgi:hypothetical protein
MKDKNLHLLMIGLITVSLMLTACGAAAPTASQKQALLVVDTTVAKDDILRRQAFSTIFM